MLCIYRIYIYIRYVALCSYVATSYTTIKVQISDYNCVAKINGGSRLEKLTTMHTKEDNKMN